MVDRAVIGSGQGADGVEAAHAGLLHADVFHHTGAVYHTEEPHIVVGWAAAGKPDDAVIRAVEAASEVCISIADRGEAAGCVAEHAGRGPHLAGVGERGGEIEVVRQGVTGGEIHGHQLQLVRVAEGGAVFHAQEGASRAFHHEPSVAETPAAIAALAHQLAGGQTRTAGRT